MIDRVPERLALAAQAGAEPINFVDHDVYDRLQELTQGRGPDRCIDAVGMEAHGGGSADAVLDRAKAAMGLATDRIHALRQAITNCRAGGTVSIAGVYGGFIDHVPFGAAFQKGLTLRMGQTHVPRYTEMLMEKILRGDIKPSEIITHELPLDEGPSAYETFKKKEDHCVKVVLHP